MEITGFYGHPESSNRHYSWELLRRLHGIPELRQLSWLVCGDFNEICYDTEKSGGNIHPLHQTQAFRVVLDECSLQDLHSTSLVFTWVNSRINEELIFEHLDRFVGTFEWRILYPAARVQTLEFFNSDHRAIFLELGSVSSQRYSTGSRYRFETHWATEVDIDEVVARGRRGDGGTMEISTRIQNCKNTLVDWAGERF